MKLTIDDLSIKKSSRAKSITVRMDKLGGFVVTFPASFSDRKIGIYLKRNSNDILESISRILSSIAPQTIFTMDSVFTTFSHRLVIGYHIGETKYIVNNDSTEVLISNEDDIFDVKIQAVIRKAIEVTLKQECKVYIPKLVEKIAKENGFEYGKLGFRASTTRWGSCSNKKNLSFNVHLMRLPEHLIEYIVVHELVHTEFMNHQKEFWDRVLSILPNARVQK